MIKSCYARFNVKRRCACQKKIILWKIMSDEGLLQIKKENNMTK